MSRSEAGTWVALEMTANLNSLHKAKGPAGCKTQQPGVQAAWSLAHPLALHSFSSPLCTSAPSPINNLLSYISLFSINRLSKKPKSPWYPDTDSQSLKQEHFGKVNKNKPAEVSIIPMEIAPNDRPRGPVTSRTMFPA